MHKRWIGLTVVLLCWVGAPGVCSGSAMYYFAYGSNMNHQQMKQRCPNSRFIRKARLDGFRFVYDGNSRTRGGAVANIQESRAPGSVVWGGLFEIDEDDLAALDRYEGHPRSYQRRTVTVRDEQGTDSEAIIYYRTGEDLGKPSGQYRTIVIEGAENCQLPWSYVASVLAGQ